VFRFAFVLALRFALIEAANVREEVLVREGVVGRRDAVNSRAEALPKNLIAPHLHRFTRGGVLEA
jgi:hypothetical protein